MISGFLILMMTARRGQPQMKFFDILAASSRLSALRYARRTPPRASRLDRLPAQPPACCTICRQPAADFWPFWPTLRAGLSIQEAGIWGRRSAACHGPFSIIIHAARTSRSHILPFDGRFPMLRHFRPILAPRASKLFQPGQRKILKK